MKYIILSLKHGTTQKPVFWRANNAGYTYSPFFAGVYTEEQVSKDPDYYNDGYHTVAVPLTDACMDSIGFMCSYDEKAAKQFWSNSPFKPIPGL